MSDDKDPFEEAPKKGCVVVTPKANEVFVDIDDAASLAVFQQNLDILNQERADEWTYAITPSPSGARDHLHIVVTLDREVNEYERLGLQAILGSDRKREALCWLRADNELEPVTCFFEKEQPLNIVPFTQFMRPDGRQVPTGIDVGDELGALAYEMRLDGVRFESEVLRDGTCSFEVCRDDADGENDTLAMRLVPNGPGVPDAVASLIREAHAAWKRRPLPVKPPESADDQDIAF